VRQLAWGIQRKGSPYSYVAPDAAGCLHDSMTAAWRLLEWIPKPDRAREWPQRQSRFGFYLPDREPRVIPAGASIHASLVRRMEALPDYRPVNLPPVFETVPMPEER
jgi:hypothetical protein